MIRRSLAAAGAVCLALLAAGCDARTPAPAAEAVRLSAPVEMRLSVKGMHCEGCEGAICGKVEKIAGVTKVKASHTEESVEVTAPPEQRAAIEEAITKLGYKLGQ
jgi:copper chaperone CopZ